jgi:hypothetical protein
MGRGERGRGQLQKREWGMDKGKWERIRFIAPVPSPCSPFPNPAVVVIPFPLPLSPFPQLQLKNLAGPKEALSQGEHIRIARIPEILRRIPSPPERKMHETVAPQRDRDV